MSGEEEKRPVTLGDFPGWAAGWAKPDRRPIYEWAFDHLSLPASYAIQGRFDVSITRPLIALFDDIQNPLVRRVRFRKPPRFGGSLVADIAIPWIVCNDPGPIMWNWQSDDDARGHMKEKGWPLWNTCKPFRAILPRDRHDKTTTEVYFGPFFMVCQGANLNNLQSKGIRWMFNDELWLPVWQDLYGYAVSRTRDYAKTKSEKIVDVSHAGQSKDVEDKNWREGHQAVWGYKSPVDGKHYPLLMGGKREDGSRWGLVWNEDAKRQDGTYNRQRAIETARYVCKETGHTWRDSPETIAAWNRDGAYLPQNPTAPADIRSYGVNALLNSSFADLIQRKLNAMELASYGDMTGLKEVKQQDECVPWEEVHLTVEIKASEAGYKLADYANGEKWDGEAHRVMTVDRQHGIGKDAPHRWVEVRAFQANGDSRQLWFGRLETKEAVRDLQMRMKVMDRCVWQDMRFEKALVMEECAEYGWVGVWSDVQNSWTHYLSQGPGRDPLKVRHPYSPIQKADMGNGRLAHYLHFNDTYMSDILHNLLSGRGVKFDMPVDVSAEYVAHLKAEHKVEKRPGVFRWEKLTTTKPNHGRDTSKMAVCFAVVLKLLAAPPLKEEKAA